MPTPSGRSILSWRTSRSSPPGRSCPTLGSGRTCTSSTPVCCRECCIDEQRKKLKVDLRDYDPEDIYTRILSEDIDSFAYPRENFTGFYEFLSRELPSSVRAVKGQVTGPVSLGLQMTDQDDRPVIYDETYAEIIRREPEPHGQLAGARTAQDVLDHHHVRGRAVPVNDRHPVRLGLPIGRVDMDPTRYSPDWRA